MIVGCAIYIIALDLVNLQCSALLEQRLVLHVKCRQGTLLCCL